MQTSDRQPSTRLLPLFLAWLVLVVLTLLSLGLGNWLEGFAGLPTLVSAIIWLKAWVVALYFLETPLSNNFVRRLVWIFIAFAPIALALTDLYGREFANLVQL